MDNKKAQNFFHDLYDHALKTKSGKIWFKIFIGSLFCLFFIEALFRWSGDQRPSWVGTLVSMVAPIGFFAWLVSMLVLGVKTLGLAAGKDSFASQGGHVFVRLGLWLFLPALIVTVVLVFFVTPLVRGH